MTLISENIKFLRKKEGLTQEQMAQKIGIKRSLQGAYEEGRADPRITNLIAYAKHFGYSVDDFISSDLSLNYSHKQNSTTNKAPRSKDQNNSSSDNRLSNIENVSQSNEDLKVLTISVDQNDEEYIELIPQKASAGYLNGYADPEYIKEQQKFQLPFLPKGATYRAFEISGDSMLPLKPGTIIIGQYLESIKDIRNGKTYIILTHSEGIVYKRVFNYLDTENCLHLVSDNPSYAAYNVESSDIIEIWEAKAFIGVTFPEKEEEMSMEKLTNIVLDLQNEVIKLKNN